MRSQESKRATRLLHLSGLKCVTVDISGVVYVSEINHRYHHVSVFTSEGQFVTSFGSGWGDGEGQGEFNCPYGLAVDDSGVVYVCDMLNNRVQVF